jgi:hypothetical protein
MAKVRLLNGKPLLVSGKVAMADTCCCTTPVIACPLPDGECVAAVCFELYLDATDTADADFFDMSGPGGGMGVYFDGVSWQVYADTNATLAATDPFSTWHAFKFKFKKEIDLSVSVTWTVDDVPGPTFNLAAAGATNAVFDSVQFGAQFTGNGNPKHRSIRNIRTTSDGAGFEFSFPPDSFDSLNGGASIDVDGNLRIDSTNPSIDDYGAKAVHLNANCCASSCPETPGWRDCSEVTGFSVTFNITGHADDLGDPSIPPCLPPTCCPGYDVTESHTFNFTRIDRAVPLATSSQFWLFVQHNFGDACNLFMTRLSSDVRWDFPITDGVCGLILGPATFGGAGSLEDPCGGGTASADVTAGVTLDRCQCHDGADPDNITDCTGCGSDPACVDPLTPVGFCNELACALPSDAFADIGTWQPGDVSGIKGSHSASNTCTFTNPPDGLSGTITVAVILTIF